MALAAPDVDLFDYFRAMMLEGEIPALGDFTERPEWQPFGACWGTGPEVFFLSLGKNSAPAKALCRGCPVPAVTVWRRRSKIPSYRACGAARRRVSG